MLPLSILGLLFGAFVGVVSALYVRALDQERCDGH